MLQLETAEGVQLPAGLAGEGVQVLGGGQRVLEDQPHRMERREREEGAGRLPGGGDKYERIADGQAGGHLAHSEERG